MTSWLLQPAHDLARPASFATAREVTIAFALGTAAVAGCQALAWATGLVPADSNGFAMGGAGLAIVAAASGAIGLGVRKLRTPSQAATPSHAAAVEAMRFQSLLALAVVAKLAVLVVSVLVLRGRGAKFEDIAAFAITFAAAALIFQASTAGYLMAVVSRRSRSRSRGWFSARPSDPTKN
ncbi:MAG: hypothetical protein ABIP94_09645 [Planctomycetota bacterium]